MNTLLRASWMAARPAVRAFSTVMAARPAAIGAGSATKTIFPPISTPSVLQHRNMSAAPVPTQAEAEEKIINLLMTFEPLEALGREKVTVDAHFINDLGLDSLDIVECVMMIEDEFAIQLSDAQAEVIESPKDLLQFIPMH